MISASVKSLVPTHKGLRQHESVAKMIIRKTQFKHHFDFHVFIFPYFLQILYRRATPYDYLQFCWFTSLSVMLPTKPSGRGGRVSKKPAARLGAERPAACMPFPKRKEACGSPALSGEESITGDVLPRSSRQKRLRKQGGELNAETAVEKAARLREVSE